MLTESEGDKAAYSSFTDIAGLFEQTILLTGQSFHRLVYQRRYNILSTLIDNSNKVNELLKEHDPLLNEPSNTYLFGDKFEEILTKSTAAQKKLSGVFTGLKKPGQSSATKTAGQQKPFRKGPFSPNENSGGGKG